MSDRVCDRSLSAMSGSVSVTAVLGVGSSSPHCYVLRVDEWSLLLDCGWNAAMDESLFSAAALSLLSSVDCVLLSHSSFRHCGALPYIRRRVGLSCPIYATLPVARMGAMTLYDHYQQHVAGITPLDSSRQQQQQQANTAEQTAAAMDEEDELFSLDDIDAVFDSMRLLKYSEELPLSDRLAPSSSEAAAASSAQPSSSRVVISPHASGHTVGGCVWRIVCEGAVLLYAVDYNHAGERHLDGGLLEAFTRPSLLIMDCASLSPRPALPLLHRPQQTAAVAAPSNKRKSREARLLDAVLGCVNGGGVCLLPVDSAGRVLELLALLHLTWEASRMYERVPLLFASPQSGTTVEFAQQQVEWLSDAMQKHLNSERSNPFHLPHLHTVTDLQQLDAITQRCTKPAVILATSHSLQPNSLSMAVMERIASQPASLILLTHELEQATVAHDLFTRALQADGAAFTLPFCRPSRVALEGEELRQYLLRAKVRDEQRQMESNQQTAVDGRLSDDDDDEQDDNSGDDEDDTQRPAVAAAHPQPQSGKQQQQHILSAANGHSGPMQASAYSSAAVPASLSSLSSPSSFPSSHTSVPFPPFYQFPFSDPRRQSDLYGEMVEQSQQAPPPPITGSSRSLASPRTELPSTRIPTVALTVPSEQRTVRPSAAAFPSSPPSSSSVSPSPPSSVASSSGGSKCVWQWAELSVQCGVSYVDFRGVSDETDWKVIVSHVKPRKLVLVRGQDEEKRAFRHYCIDKRICAPANPAPVATASASGMNAQAEKAGNTAAAMEVDSAVEESKPPLSAASTAVRGASASADSAGGAVLIAAVLSAVDISSELSYRFGMAPSLLSRLRFARVADFEVAHTTAVVKHNESALPQLLSVDGLSSSSPSSPIAQSLLSATARGSVFLGDYRFADFRRILASAGIDSEFYVKGGVLVAAGGSVRIRKTSPNTLTVQGVISEQFYAVRALLYSQYSIVTPHTE